MQISEVATPWDKKCGVVWIAEDVWRVDGGLDTNQSCYLVLLYRGDTKTVSTSAMRGNKHCWTNWDRKNEK